MKMGEEQMDLIVGVDFGMTCTGKTRSSITPSLLGGVLSARQTQPHCALGHDRYQKAPLDLLKNFNS